MISAMVRLADRIGTLQRWRRWLFLMSIGAFATLALPPVNFLPAVILSGVGLVWCMAFGPEGKWSGFAAGWAFSFGYFVFGLYWVGNALLVFADQHAWMLPFAALGLPAFLAIFGGLAGVAISFARGPLATPIAVTAAFGAADWLRGHILTGLPWNLFGHAWSGIDPLLQSASLYGVYGMGIVVLLTATLPGGLVSPVRWQRLAAILIPIAILGTHWAAGAYRLRCKAAAIQVSVFDWCKQHSAARRRALRYRARNIAAHLRLSVENRPPWIQHVIWPEMAATLYLERDAKSREVLSRVVPPGGLLVTGAPRRNPEGAPTTLSLRR